MNCKLDSKLPRETYFVLLPHPEPGGAPRARGGPQDDQEEGGGEEAGEEGGGGRGRPPAAGSHHSHSGGGGSPAETTSQVDFGRGKCFFRNGSLRKGGREKLAKTHFNLVKRWRSNSRTEESQK